MISQSEILDVSGNKQVTDDLVGGRRVVGRVERPGPANATGVVIPEELTHP